MRGYLVVALGAAAMLSGCVGDEGPGYASDHSRYGNYDYNRPDPTYNGYYADHYYRSGNHSRARRLSQNDRVYRGSDNRYYCRRSDGTTGLIVGGIAGGLLGNIIAPGGSEVLGTLLGAAGGAVAGKAIDKNSVTCK